MTAGTGLVFSGGVIRTMDPAVPRAEAVAIEGSRIVAVGASEDVRSRTGRAEQIDLQGRLLLPGFIDAHNHFLATGESMGSVDVRHPQVGSTKQLVRAIAAAAGKTPPGQWVPAWGFDHVKYGERHAPFGRISIAPPAGISSPCRTSPDATCSSTRWPCRCGASMSPPPTMRAGHSPGNPAGG